MHSPEQNIERLWKRYLKTRDVALRNQLVVHYSPLVHTHAARWTRKLLAKVSYDEMCSFAFDGLIEAVEAFYPQRKAKFETFCQQRISGAIMDGLRSLDPQRRSARAFEKRTMSAQESREIARQVAISLARYEQLSRISALGREAHSSAMESPDQRHRDSPRHTWDLQDPKGSDPLSALVRHELTEYIVHVLSREERLVLVLYYYEQMTMAEIGNVLDLSESRVSQIYKDVMDRLRQRFADVSAHSGDRSCLANSNMVEQCVLSIRAYIDEFTPVDEAVERLKALISALNAYHVASGGNGLIVDDLGFFTTVSDNAEILS